MAATKKARKFAKPDTPQVKFELTDVLSVSKSTLYQKSMFAPYNPDDLVQKFGASGQGLDKYDKMLNDDAVKAALTTKKSAIIASGWTIQPADDSDEAKEMAKWVETNLRETFVGNFDASLYEMLDAFEYGFTVTEKVYAIENGSLILKELKTRPSQSFEFHCDDKGYLQEDGLKQWTKNAVISIPQDKVIIYSYDKKRDNFYGNSDLRAAYRAWFSKDFTIKMMNIAIERIGNPIVVMKYPRNASPDERADMKDIADNISARTSMLFPEEANIEFVQAQNNMDLFQKAIDIYNLSILKSILLPEKMGFGGDTGGSYALGKVQQDTYFWIIEKIRNEVETLVTEGLIRQLIDYNFGIQDKYPRFKFNPLSEDNKDEKAKILIDALARAALIPDLDTENYLRGLLGLPEKEEDEVEIVDDKQKSSDKGNNNNDESENGDIDGDKSEENNKFIARASHKNTRRKSVEFKLRRKKTSYEEKVDFQKIDNDLNENVMGAVDNLQEILKKIRDDYTNQIIRKKIMENKDVNAVKTLEFKYIRDYALECESFLRDSYNQGKNTAKDVYKSHRKNFAKATTNIGLVKSKALMYIKDKAKVLAGDVAGKLQNKVRGIVYDGVMNGDPINVIIEKVDNAFAPMIAKTGTEGYDYDGKSLYTPVNTEISKAFSAGLMEFNKDLEASGEIVAYQWSAILDGVTTEGCEDLDGLIYEVTNSAWSKLSTPRHWNCRSQMVPIFRDEEYIADEDIGVYNEF